MNCEPALAVMSAKFSRRAKELWMAAREAEAERKQTFLPGVGNRVCMYGFDEVGARGLLIYIYV